MKDKDAIIPIIVADDDLPVANLISSYLSNFPEIKVLTLTEDGLKTIEEVRKLKPAVVFLDIEMPFMDGLTVAQQLTNEMSNILMVFVTSYPNYAADAFQFGAVDYIVKPVTSEAINRSVARIKKYMNINKKAETEVPAVTDAQRLVISNNRGAYFINPAEIIFIEKSERNSNIHMTSGIVATSETLQKLQTRLCNNNFFRCHKSFIINMDKVEKIHPIAERIYEINFYNYEKTATMSGNKLNEFIAAVKLHFKE